MGIHEIMRLAYIGVFACYEEFLVRSTRLLSGHADVQTTSRNFRDILSQAFGSDTTQLCWSSTKITNIRKIRNTLTHAGGKLKENDSVLADTIYVNDKYMNVYPAHIIDMYRALKPAILALIVHPGFA